MLTITGRRWSALVLTAVLVLAVAACDAKVKGATRAAPTTDVPTQPSAVAMKHPGAFKPPLYSPGILVYSQDPLPASVVDAARALPGVVESVQFSMATF